LLPKCIATSAAAAKIFEDFCQGFSTPLVWPVQTGVSDKSQAAEANRIRRPRRISADINDGARPEYGTVLLVTFASLGPARNAVWALTGRNSTMPTPLIAFRRSGAEAPLRPR
jgi:hypothetical protein